ncbi:MAG: glycosyltransferase family 9 protein [Bacteroidota bacterium]
MKTQAINRILISRMKFIGDIVLTTPVIHAVRDRYPDAFIAFLGEYEGAALLENNPHLNEILKYDFSRPDIIEQTRMAFALRKRKFDVFIDLFSNPRTALLAYLSGANIRIGKDAPGRGNLYTHRIGDDGKKKTAIEFHYRYVEPIDVSQKYRKTELYLTDAEIREAKIFLQWQNIDLKKPVIGLHPGATWPAKMWQKESFVELIDLINAKLHCQVVITQGPKEAGLAAEISKAAVGNVVVLNPLPLRQLAAVIRQFNVYVANDSGPMHISVAVGTKTIGIFGPGEDDIWFPYTPPYYEAEAGHIALRKDVPCHPCHLDFCNRSGAEFMECMKLLSVKEVFEEVEKRAG